MPLTQQQQPPPPPHNDGALAGNAPAARKKKVEPWRNSKAKRLLYKDIVKGIVSEDAIPYEVYGMRDEYQVYKYENFVTNLKNLLRLVDKKQAFADSDEAAFNHDLAFRTFAKGWSGSEAQKYLQEDISEGKHLTMKPKELHQTRAEYQEYSEKKFRDFIYKERDKKKQKTYWLAKKKKKYDDWWGSDDENDNNQELENGGGENSEDEVEDDDDEED
jgi:hypothetical protein